MDYPQSAFSGDLLQIGLRKDLLMLIGRMLGEKSQSCAGAVYDIAHRGRCGDDQTAGWFQVFWDLSQQESRVFQVLNYRQQEDCIELPFEVQVLSIQVAFEKLVSPSVLLQPLDEAI